ncbi:hypothetical protein F5B20DRAFT_523612 [Whalleya microplaca]|nr:hypothetical protein F5B20DRAFT_523612 [Whalleya microplaca]
MSEPERHHASSPTQVTPDSTGIVSASPTRERPLPPPSRRRDKPQLSCNLCRQRKVKCDRQQPCKTCCNRGLACIYPSYMSLRPSSRDHHRRNLQDRIRDLESLALDLMQQARTKDQRGLPTATSTSVINSGPAETFASLPSQDLRNADSLGPKGSPKPSECGRLTNSPGGVNYVDSTHWAALLDSIADLKDYFNTGSCTERQEFQNPRQLAVDSRPGPLLLYGHFTHASKAEILSAIPPQAVVDRLLARYFSALDMAPALLHRTQFLRQYEQFWANPPATPIMWVGLLFAIMCIATESRILSVSPLNHCSGATIPEEDEIALVNIYREKVIQCLTMGNYIRGGPHVVETLTLYLVVEHFMSEDTNFGISILASIVVQVAMRMGYHRDPKNFPTISPFEGEMRRRVWATINQLEHTLSSQMGLPSMLQQQHVDTEEPHNLMDSDFDEGVKELPPSRPETETTDVIYTIIKSRISYVGRRVCDIATDARSHSYEEILYMDRQLQEARERLPSNLGSQSTKPFITDSPRVIIQRMWLDISFRKLQIILHKKYFLAESNTDGDYSYSRDVSLEAAMQILEYQHLLFEETQFEGRLCEMQWRITSIMRHPFLLATSILCIYLKQHNSTPTETEAPAIQKITSLLKRSLDIWTHSSTTSKEAQRAVDALHIVLNIKVTAEANCGSAEGNPDPMLPLQDSRFEFDFPFAFDSFVHGDNSMMDGRQGTEPIQFTQQKPHTEWIDMFQQVFVR